MFSSSFIRNVVLTVVLGVGLVVTYNRCIECVFCIMLISGLTMSCIPTMPLVFMLSCGVLLMHAIDYRDATIKVEVPLENLVYIPTWDDVHKYVHFSQYGSNGNSNHEQPNLIHEYNQDHDHSSSSPSSSSWDREIPVAF